MEVSICKECGSANISPDKGGVFDVEKEDYESIWKGTYPPTGSQWCCEVCVKN